MQFQSSELQVCSYTEERRCATYERRVGWETDIAGLNQFYYLILLALVFQFQVLCVEVKGGIGIIVQVHIDLVAHLTVHAQVYLLVEVYACSISVAYGQRGVVDAFQRSSEFQLGSTLSLDAHSTGAEYFLSWSEVEVHIGEVEFLFTLCGYHLFILRFEVLVEVTSAAPFDILLRSHHHRCPYPCATDFVADDVHVECVVVHHILFQVVRSLQVGWYLVEVFQGDRYGALNAPAGV